MAILQEVNSAAADAGEKTPLPPPINPEDPAKDDPTEDDKLLHKCDVPKILNESEKVPEKNDDEKTVDTTKELLKFWQLPLTKKFKIVKDNMTVEPMMFFYIFSSVLASVATQNLYLEKACRVNLAYDDEVCDALSRRETQNYTQQELMVQELTAGVLGWKTFVANLIPALSILFSGSWSDRHGLRKPFMLLPIAGELCTSLALLTCTIFFYELPMEVAGLSEAIFPAITGGWVTNFMAVFSYVAEISPEKTRTLRIGIVNLFFQMGIPVGSSLSGILYKKLGFYGVFSLSASLYVFSLWYGFTMIKEKPKPDLVGNPKNLSFIGDFFDTENIKDTIRVTFKAGAHNRRLKVILIMINVMLVIGPLHGEFVVLYLFLRLKFNWDEVTYSIFSTYNVLINLIGTAISVGFLSHKLKFDDAIIGMLSSTSKILASLVFAFASVSWMMYAGAVVDMMNGTSFIAMRSIISKLVPSNELGKVNSLFGVCEALVPLVCAPLYSKVYQVTMHSFPGAFWLIGGLITGPAVLIFGWIYLDHRKEKKLEKQKKKNEKEKLPLEEC